jgi:hypothetical protein
MVWRTKTIGYTIASMIPSKTLQLCRRTKKSPSGRTSHNPHKHPAPLLAPVWRAPPSCLTTINLEDDDDDDLDKESLCGVPSRKLAQAFSHGIQRLEGPCHSIGCFLVRYTSVARVLDDLAGHHFQLRRAASRSICRACPPNDSRDS